MRIYLNDIGSEGSTHSLYDDLSPKPMQENNITAHFEENEKIFNLIAAEMEPLDRGTAK
jgi:hypothetical protein